MLRKPLRTTVDPGDPGQSYIPPTFWCPPVPPVTPPDGTPPLGAGGGSGSGSGSEFPLCEWVPTYYEPTDPQQGQTYLVWVPRNAPCRGVPPGG